MKVKINLKKFTVNIEIIFKCDLQGNSKSFNFNLKVPPSECYRNWALEKANAFSSVDAAAANRDVILVLKPRS